MSTSKLPNAATALRRIADLAEDGEVTGVVVLAVVGGKRMQYRGHADPLALAELVLGTMDLVDTMRKECKGEELPETPSVATTVKVESWGLGGEPSLQVEHCRKNSACGLVEGHDGDCVGAGGHG